jgi:hypothetical protein
MRGDELGGRETKHTWLINVAVEAPLQFPKNRKMILQLPKSLFDSEQVLLTRFEGHAASRSAFTDIGLLDEKHR